MVERRFALLCQHFYPEMISTGMHMTELADRLSQLGWQITVYCARPSWGVEEGTTPQRLPRVSSYHDIEIRRMPTIGSQRTNLLSRALFALSFLLSTMGTLWRQRDDYPGLVLTTNPPFLGLIGWLFSRLSGKPYLLIVYDVYPDIAVNLGVLRRHGLLARLWAWITRAIFSRASVLVVIGRDMAEVVKEKVAPQFHNRIVLIPNWSDERRVEPIPAELNTFRQEHELEGKFVVQYAGRMGRTHNLEPLIEAARLMTGEAVLFQFIGEGAKKANLEATVDEYVLDNVAFLPYQPMERLAEMLSAADVGVVCLDEAFTGLSVPSKTYGILASGTPVLGFLEQDSEIGRLIRETDCGYVLERPSAVEIASVVRSLRDEHHQRELMGQAARETFLARYTLACAAGLYDRALVNMLALSASPATSPMGSKRTEAL